MSSRITIALLVALSLVGAACGEDDEPASEGGAAQAEATAEPTPDEAITADTLVRVPVGEWFVKPNRAKVKAGGIEFEVPNEGEVEHELEVVETDTAPESFPLEGNKADVEAVGEEMGEVEDIAAGEAKKFTVALEPGKYVLICNLPDHYQAGMYAGLAVK